MSPRGPGEQCLGMAAPSGRCPGKRASSCSTPTTIQGDRAKSPGRDRVRSVTRFPRGQGLGWACRDVAARGPRVGPFASDHRLGSQAAIAAVPRRRPLRDVAEQALGSRTGDVDVSEVAVVHRDHAMPDGHAPHHLSQWRHWSRRPGPWTSTSGCSPDSNSSNGFSSASLHGRPAKRASRGNGHLREPCAAGGQPTEHRQDPRERQQGHAGHGRRRGRDGVAFAHVHLRRAASEPAADRGHETRSVAASVGPVRGARQFVVRLARATVGSRRRPEQPR